MKVHDNPPPKPYPLHRFLSMYWICHWMKQDFKLLKRQFFMFQYKKKNYKGLCDAYPNALNLKYKVYGGLCGEFNVFILRFLLEILCFT